jgi:hypothetical protein
MTVANEEERETVESGLPGVRVTIRPTAADEPGKVRMSFEIVFDQRDGKARDKALLKMAKVIKLLVPPQERGEFLETFKAAAVVAMAAR